MPVKHETSTRFMDEVRIISPWFFFVAVLGFLSAVVAVAFVVLTDKSGTPPPIVLIPLGFLGGFVIACYILLIGYVNRDAGRRGMSRLLWTLIAILIPHALGIVLYFVLRQPRVRNCPRCGAGVQSGFGFCPRCRCQLNVVCPQCQRGVQAGDKFCPYCGNDLASTINPVPVAVPQ